MRSRSIAARPSSGGSPGFYGALVRELQQQIEAFERAEEELGWLRSYAARPGTPIVYDTNMLVHWRPPDEVKWTEVLRAEGVRTKEVRLVVPLVVIDELDRHKSGAGERAAKALRYLGSQQYSPRKQRSSP
ncbi:MULTISPECIES: PIN domain-containing protein [Streptomyces]|uniref:PIN domain-containing protein n=1 Tax=Streptomyces spororaveus TaxID=284039 RepID=A0ABQ3T3K2_9ACTN|nr:PIN domain-containing protein [Streptomyces spororaveus]MCM9077160.1 PIN domain-containing protein [Streptomyces spororaveus]GHI74973.1 hypothetical protein Sspor_05340 [Streptomyces spororaveus]